MNLHASVLGPAVLRGRDGGRGHPAELRQALGDVVVAGVGLLGSLAVPVEVEMYEDLKSKSVL